MKMIYGGINGTFSLTDIWYNCTRNPSCQKLYFVPVVSFDDLMLYLDFPAKPTTITFKAENCGGGGEVLMTYQNYVVAQRPDGRWYGVFTQWLPDITSIGQQFFIMAEVMIGGIRHIYLTQQLVQEQCAKVCQLAACYNDTEITSDATDCNGLYYGFPATAGTLGNEALRYYHKTYVRDCEVIPTKTKFQFTYFNSNVAYKNSVTKNSMLKFELVPDFYKDEIVGVLGRGNIEIDGKAYRLEESQDIGLTNEDLKWWKMDLVLTDVCKTFFSCNPTICIPAPMPPPSCEDEFTDASFIDQGSGQWAFSLTGGTLDAGDTIEWELLTLPKAVVRSWGLAVVTTVPNHVATINLFHPLDLTIAWGDGTTSVITDATATSAVHTYATAGSYNISLSGDMLQDGKITPSPLGSILKATTAIDSELADFFQVFKDTGLTGSIPAGMFTKCPNVTRLSQAFFNCSGLTGAIPADMIAGCLLVTNLDSIFFGCSGLTGNIPATLFANNHAAKGFAGTFWGCSGLTGSIPAGLFAGCPQTIDFGNTFNNCSGLTGSIPATLFASNTQVLGFPSVFRNCTGLTGSIPATLFSTNTKATNFQSSFENCLSLSGAIPVNLFAGTLATNFVRSFYNCSSLSGNAPALWIQFPSATGTDCFKADVQLGNYFEIPVVWGGASIFSTMIVVTTTASYAASIVFDTPVDMAVDWGEGVPVNVNGGVETVVSHTYATAGTYAVRFGGAATRFVVGDDGTRKNLSEILSAISLLNGSYTSMKNTFRWCKITSIPVGVFGAFPSITTFEGCFGNCFNLTGNVPALWTSYPAAIGKNCFLNDTLVTNYASIPVAWGGGRVSIALNNITLIDIPFMYADLKPNTRYSVFGVLRGARNSGSAAAKMAFTIPAGATMNIGMYGYTSGTGTQSQEIFSQSGVASLDNWFGGGGGIVTNGIFQGTVVTGANGGKLQLQMRLNIVSGSITIYNDSRMDVVEDASVPVLAADFTTNSSTLVDVTGQAFALQPFKTYRLSFVGVTNATGGTAYIAMSVPVNAAVSGGQSREQSGASQTVSVYWGVANLWQTSLINAPLDLIFTAIIRTGNTGGNAQLQLKSGAGFTATVQAGALLSVVESPNACYMAADFSTTSGALVDVPPLTLPVQAGKLYRVYGGFGYTLSSAVALAWKTPSATPNVMNIMSKVVRQRGSNILIGTFRNAAPAPTENTFGSGTGSDTNLPALITGYIRPVQDGNIIVQTRNADASPITAVTVQQGSGFEVQEVDEFQ